MIQENALTQHRDALQSWEEEKERRQNEFTLTDTNLTEIEGFPMDEVLPLIHMNLFSDVTAFFPIW